MISAQDDEKPALLLTHSIPTEVANDKSLLMHIVLEFIEQEGGASPDNAGKDVFAFISDVSNGNIVVFDWRKGVSYKKSSIEMRQSVEQFEVLNQQVMSAGRSGVRGLALQSQPSLKVHCCNSKINKIIFKVTLKLFIILEYDIDTYVCLTRSIIDYCTLENLEKNCSTFRQMFFMMNMGMKI